MRIRKRKTKRKRIKLKKTKKLKRGRGFWDNLNKGLGNAFGYSDAIGYY